MIVVRLMGGLGNQMFQYAAGNRLAQHHNTVLKLDLTFLLDRSPRQNFTFREFDLDVFDLKTEIATQSEVRLFRRRIERKSRSLIERFGDKFSNRNFYLEKSAEFDPSVLTLPDHTYLEGYFQNEKYFNDIADVIRKKFGSNLIESDLSPPVCALFQEIRSSESICLHVRRGDYVTNPVTEQFHGVCRIDYFHKGIDLLRAKGIAAKVFVFSDDSAWCRENFQESRNLVVVPPEYSGRRGAVHFRLMSACKHFIIPNSSFSWWAAWLGSSPDKKVVAPRLWFREPGMQKIDPCPIQWIRVSN